MRRGRLRRSGLMPLVLICLATLGALGTVIGSGWSPKLGLDLEGGFSVSLQPVDDAPSETLDQAIEVIRSRVDALGVAEPEITRQGDTIEVSLPGVTDADRARELVGQTAELRFRPVLNLLPVGVDSLDDITTTTVEGEDAPADTTGTTSVDDTSTSETVEGQSAGHGATPFQDETTSTTAAPTTTTAPAAPPLDDLSTTPREDDLPGEVVILEETDDEGTPIAKYQLGPAAATGEIVQSARAELPTTEWVVALEIKGGDAIDTFNQIASQCFNGAPTCPTRRLAIVLDGRVVSAPNISQPSYERDQIVISGSFTERDAKDLALVLRYGSLPVALEIQQTRDVSATLGSDSLRAGVISGLIGLAIVTLYMVAYYRLLGLVAIASLALSGAMLWTIVCWMGETQGLALTLAGVTGIIVSIGIAVDSNVVFYEHLKEDVGRGRSVRSAVSGSFASAFGTIVKADIASLIGAALLYFLTVGPVRGFAFFLGLSTILDIVASYFFMRPLVVRMARSRRVGERPQLLGLPGDGSVTA